VQATFRSASALRKQRRRSSNGCGDTLTDERRFAAGNDDPNGVIRK
jgi:hypothetical protein